MNPQNNERFAMSESNMSDSMNQPSNQGPFVSPSSSPMGVQNPHPSTAYPSAIPIALPSPVVASVALSRKRRRGMCVNVADKANDPTNSLLSRLTFNSIPAPSNLIDILSAHPLLRSQPPPVLAALTQECTCISVPVGSTIVAAGSTMDMFYIVLRGEVHAISPNSPHPTPPTQQHMSQQSGSPQQLFARHNALSASPASLASPPRSLGSDGQLNIYNNSLGKSAASLATGAGGQLQTASQSFSLVEDNSTTVDSQLPLAATPTRIRPGESFGDVCLVHPTLAASSYIAARPVSDGGSAASMGDNVATGLSGSADSSTVLLAQMKGISCRYIMATHSRSQHSAVSLFLNQLPCLRDLHGLPRASHGVIRVVPQLLQNYANNSAENAPAMVPTQGFMQMPSSPLTVLSSTRSLPRSIQLCAASTSSVTPANADGTGLSRATSPGFAARPAGEGRQGSMLSHASPLTRANHAFSVSHAGNGKSVFPQGMENSRNVTAGNFGIRDSPVDTLTPGVLTPADSEHASGRPFTTMTLQPYVSGVPVAEAAVDNMDIAECSDPLAGTTRQVSRPQSHGGLPLELTAANVTVMGPVAANGAGTSAGTLGAAFPSRTAVGRSSLSSRAQGSPGMPPLGFSPVLQTSVFSFAGGAGNMGPGSVAGSSELSAIMSASVSAQVVAANRAVRARYRGSPELMPAHVSFALGDSSVDMRAGNFDKSTRFADDHRTFESYNESVSDHDGNYDHDDDDNDDFARRRARAKQRTDHYTTSDDSDDDRDSDAFPRRPLRAPTSTPCSSDIVCLQQPVQLIAHATAMEALARHVDRLAEGAAVLYLSCLTRVEAEVLRRRGQQEEDWTEKSVAVEMKTELMGRDFFQETKEGKDALSPTVAAGIDIALDSIQSHALIYSGDRLLPQHMATSSMVSPMASNAQETTQKLTFNRSGVTVAVSMEGTEAASPSKTTTVVSPSAASARPATRYLVALSGKLILLKPGYQPLSLSCGDMAVIDAETTITAASKSWFGVCQALCGVDVPDVTALAVLLPEDLCVDAAPHANFSALARVAGAADGVGTGMFVDTNAAQLDVVSPVMRDDAATNGTEKVDGFGAGVRVCGCGVGCECTHTSGDANGMKHNTPAEASDAGAAVVAVDAGVAADAGENPKRVEEQQELASWLSRYVCQWVRDDVML